MVALHAWESAASVLTGSPLVWQRDGRDWPNREASRFVDAGGLRWHVQQLGRGPVLLLVHGTGGATHSWRALAPLLARHFEVIAPDLPGHGFSARGRGDSCSLPGMAAALGNLLRSLGRLPALVVGHSAGAAILCRMCLDEEIAPRGLVSLNGALLPLAGVHAPVFSHVARLMTWNPLVPRLMAWRAHDRAVVERLIRGTGSRLEPEDVRFYARVLRNPGHVAGALDMMAHWNLEPLARDLPDLDVPVLLVVGDRDRYIPPAEATRLHALLPSAERVHLPDLGHLAHEERPDEIAALVTRFGDQVEAAALDAAGL
jgi:magnesium chelatase accessory protein